MFWLTIAAAALLVMAVGLALVLAVRATIADTYPQAFILGFLGALAFSQVSADVLSAAHIFTSPWLITAWVALGLAAVIVLWLRRRHLPVPDLARILTERWTWLIVAIVMLGTSVSGLLIAPTNYDSQTYHLPRALHWLQQGSLDFFITPNTRENINAPLPSVLHAFLLSLDDRAHLVFIGQWVAVLVTMAGAGVAARMLSPSSRPAFAALFVVSTPLVVVMASTTQADLLVCAPMAGAAVAFAMLLRDRVRPAIATMALCVGLAMAIKLTALIIIIPIAGAFAFMLVRRRDWRGVLLFGALSGFAVLVLNAAYLLKIGVIGGSSMDMASAVVNARFTPGITIGNLVKNTVTLFQVPNTGATLVLTAIVTRTLGPLGIDPFDPDATFPLYTPKFEIASEFSDATLGMPLQVLVGLVALIVAWVGGDRRLRRSLGVWMLVVAVQFILVATVLRWQPWNSRFLLPVVLMLAPIAAVAASRVWTWLRITATIALASVALALMLVGPDRGLLGTGWVPQGLLRHTTAARIDPLLIRDRFEQLGRAWVRPSEGPELAAGIDEAMDRRPTVLVIDVGMNDYREYLIWYRARGIDPAVRIVHAGDDSLATTPGTVVRLCVERCSPPPSARLFGSDASTIAVWTVAEER